VHSCAPFVELVFVVVLTTLAPRRSLASLRVTSLHTSLSPASAGDAPSATAPAPAGGGPATGRAGLDGGAIPAARVTAPREVPAGAPVTGDATAPTYGGAEAVEFLRLLAQAVGLLRVRGSRVEATALCTPWRRLEAGLRAGLVYAAWCQQVTLTGWPTDR
jgi:hypothetical protein